MINWNSIEERKKVIDERIKSQANIARKRASLKRHRVFKGHLHGYVQETIAAQTTSETSAEMPIISSVNLTKAVVTNEASIYRNEPVRRYSGSNNTETQKVLENVYFDGEYNKGFKKANRAFRLHQQCWVQPMLKRSTKKISLRVLYPHHVDVIPVDGDIEGTDAIIVSSFDPRATSSEGSERAAERYVVWTDSLNLVMDGNGALIGKIVPNPIGKNPIREIVDEKEFEVYADNGDSLTDFTVQYNVALSDLNQMLRLQGFSIMVYTAVKETVPNRVRLGPNTFFHIPINPNDPNATGKLEAVNPTPNVEGGLKFIETLLSNFISSRGQDTKMISSSLNNSERFASGVERMLAMIDRFEASKDDIDVFHKAEDEVFDITKRMLAYYSTHGNLLDKKYKVNSSVESMQMTVIYSKPEAVKTDEDKILYAKEREALGLWSLIDVLMYLDDIDEDAAIANLKLVAKRKATLKLILGTEDPENGEGDKNGKAEEAESESVAS